MTKKRFYREYIALCFKLFLIIGIVSSLKLSLVEQIIATVAVFLFVDAARYETDIKKERNTVLKAHPTSLYPSIFFGLSSENALGIELRVSAQTFPNEDRKLKAKGVTKIAIADSLKELTEAYRDSIQKENKDYKKLVLLLKKTIESEKATFLVDNGREMGNFAMERQNKLTDYLLTSILIPLIINFINVNPTSLSDILMNIRNNSVIQVAVYAFVIVFSYRVWKYFRNKRSMLRCNGMVMHYNKVALMLSCFEIAVDSEDKANQN